MSSLYPYFKIVRPLNCFLVGLSLIIGILITMGDQVLRDNWYLFFIGSIVIILISAGGFVVNDLYDVEIDKINQPSRVLPSGQITIPMAKLYTFVLFFLGFILSIYALDISTTIDLGLIPPIFVILGIISLFLYASFLKKLGLIGNLVIIGLSTIPFFVGGILIGDISKAIFPVLIVLTLQYAREIIKDVEDVKGDVEASDFILNLPTVIGIKKTILIGRLLLLLTIVITILPFVDPYFSNFKSWGVLFFAMIIDSISVYSIYILTGSEEDLIKQSTKVKVYIKIGILFGLIGLALNSFTLIN